ncbi:MAG: response regulator [Bryobacterales bacterium]|nr:response regulator [Bryobacterales bacterium]
MQRIETDRTMAPRESSAESLRECAQRSLPGAMVFFLVLAVVWVYTDYGSVFPSLMTWVTASLFALGGTRMWSSVLLVRQGRGSDPGHLRWIFFGSVTGTFAVWGVFSGFTAAKFVTNPKGLLVLLSSAAFAAAASASLAANRRLASACVMLIAVPTVLGALARQEPEARAFALLTGVYTLFLIAQIQLNWRAYWTARRVNEMELARLEAVRFAAAKSLLLATMSHEVKTPMNGVIGMIELLLGTEGLSAEAREYANHARLSALNLLGVLNGILTFSRNEKAGVTLTPADFELGAWLRQVTYPFVCEAEEKGLVLELEIELREPAWYRADSIRLSEVLTNLLSNAVKFTQAGGITVRVSPDGEDRVRFVVQDTGAGMSPVIQAQLFEPFGHSAVASGRQGTGLGLAISRQIVEAMSGQIKVSSAPGQGTTFQVTVVLQPVEAPEPVSAAPLLEACAEGYTALVVEDDPVSGLVARKLLQKLGVKAELVTSREEALRSAASRYDLFLLDVQLPDGDGLELATKLRSAELHRTALIIVVSANETGELLERGRGRGVDAFLAKPYTAAQLSDVLSLLAPR